MNGINLDNTNYDNINTGFGEMADVYDELQYTNDIVKKMRRKFYDVITEINKPPADILELNCGSGIDAHYLADRGYNVLATDISDKMLLNARLKGGKDNLVFKKISFNELDNLYGKFDLIISNLGGLNCCNNLDFISEQAARLLKNDGYFISSVMPKLTLWELILALKGDFKRGTRRLRRNGVLANVGNKKIFVKYYSPRLFNSHFSKNFKFIGTKALCVFTPPPTLNEWLNAHKKLNRLLNNIDNIIEEFYLSAFFADYFINVLKKR